MFPNTVLGLSDHTFGHASVLGAVTLGARVIEKHFTDDNKELVLTIILLRQKLGEIW